MSEIDKEKHKIKSKRFTIFIVAVIFIVVASFAAVEYFAISTFLSFTRARNTLSENVINQSEQTIKQAALSITKSADELEKSLGLIGESQDMKKLLTENKDENTKSILKIFMNYKDTHPEVENIYLGTVNKEMYIYPQVELPMDYDPTGRSWYINALNNKGFTWSEPYMDASNGASIISLSLPIYNMEELVGVISTDLNLDMMAREIKDMKLEANGYVVITDQNGIVIVNPNNEVFGPQMVNEELRDLTSKEDMGIIRYSYQDKVETAIYSKINKLKLNLIGFIKK